MTRPMMEAQLASTGVTTALTLDTVTQVTPWATQAVSAIARHLTGNAPDPHGHLDARGAEARGQKKKMQLRSRVRLWGFLWASQEVVPAVRCLCLGH